MNIDSECDFNRECNAFSEHINGILQSSEHKNILSNYLPIDGSNFFHNFRDGVLLAYLLDSLKPGSVPLNKLTLNIDLSQLNKPKTKVIFEVTANLNVSIDAAKNAKLVVVNIGANDVLEMNKDLVLGLVWQIVRAHLLAGVNLVSHPELIRLLGKGENLVSLINMKSEQILIRWINYHLTKAGFDRSIENFSKDVCDSSIYAVLMNQIAPKKITADMADKVLHVPSCEREIRANFIIEYAELLGCKKFVNAKDIANGHARLNFAFSAILFNNYIGIKLPTEEEIQDLYETIDHLKERVDSLERLLNRTVEESDKLKQESQDKITKLQHENHSLQMAHDAELDRIQKEIENYKEETTRDFNSTLDSRLGSEKKQYEDTIKQLTNKERDFRNTMQRQWAQLKMILQEELRQSKLDSALPAHKKPLPAINSNEVDQLAKEVMDLARLTVSKNQEMSSSISGLSAKIEQKERINEIMGDKIREYTTLMINERRSKK